ncbi:MAG: RNA-binding S4 domain-containing protein [Oscillospiraceae bacterium]|nr:RNA-binding S4 domain-containing protein [Oscillospiraceae bacterium]
METEFIRLDSALKFSGVAGTGGEAKIYIQNGDVRLNGSVCPERGKKLFSGDIVEFFDRLIEIDGK